MTNYILFLLIFLLTTSDAFAVGSSAFENASFSSKSIAQGNAVVAQADEPAAISYNPAGVVDLKGVQIQNNLHLISIFAFQSSSRDRHTRSSGTIVPVPTAYLTINPGKILNDRLAFGIGSDSPFGLKNKYNSINSNVRYTGWVNYLKMYAIKPVASVKITDWLSVGAGPIYYRIFDFGAIEAYPNKIVPGGLTSDGQIRANLSGNHWGWHAGVLLKPHAKHQLGFYFRSPVTIKTSGLIKVENATSGNFETGGNAKIDLPLNMTVGYAYKPSDKTVIETDFGYTKWSINRKLYIYSGSVNARENAILRALGFVDKDYSDGFSLHVGGSHRINDKLTLRAGSLFYWAVVPQDHFVPSVPDSNKLGFSIGSKYSITQNMDFEMAYVNIFGLRRKINNSISESIGGSVDGTYSSYLQELTLTLTCKFDDIFKMVPFTKKKSTIQETGN